MQTSELVQRSKVIEDLKSSLSKLITKYNELKKDYDKKFITTRQGTIMRTNFGFSLGGRLRPMSSIIKEEVGNISKMKNDNERLLGEVEKLKNESDEKDKALILLNEKMEDYKAMESKQITWLKCEFHNKIDELENKNREIIRMYEDTQKQLITVKIVSEEDAYLQQIKNDKLNRENQMLNNEIANFKLNLAEKDKLIHEHITKINTLNVSINTKEESSREAENKTQKLKILFASGIDNLTKQFTIFKSKIIEKLKKNKYKLLKLNDIITQFQINHNSNKEKYTEVTKTINILNNKLKSLNTEKAKLIQHNQDITKSLVKFEETQKESAKLIIVYEETIKSLKEKKESSKQLVEIKLDEVRGVKDENNILKRQIEELTKKLNQYVIENHGKSKIIEERNEEIRILKLHIDNDKDCKVLDI
jgi:hypothetical protein